MLSKKTLTNYFIFNNFFFRILWKRYTQLSQMFLFNQRLIEQQKRLVEILQKKREFKNLKIIASDTVDIKGLG